MGIIGLFVQTLFRLLYQVRFNRRTNAFKYVKEPLFYSSLTV